MRKRLTRSMLVGVLGATSLLATACPADPGAPLNSATFEATSVTVNNVQDEVCVLVCINRSDEPYVLNVNFRVKIGVPGSASSFVTGSRSNSVNSLAAGESAALTGGQRATATFGGIKGLDILDLLDANNKLEVFGTYAWAAEEDTVGIATAAGDVAAVLKDALNSTLATSAIPADLNFIVDIIIDNLGSAFTLVLSNIPLLGLGDDTLGGGIYIGVGAKGALGDIITATAGGASPADFPIPVVSLPPDIENVGIYTLSGAVFSGQSFSGADGQHTYTFQATGS